MNLAISARHCTLTGSVRRRMEMRIRRLVRFAPRLIGAEVNFSTDHGVYRVEVRLDVPGAPAVLATGSGETANAALDKAADRLGRRLKEVRERGRGHRTRKVSRVLALAGGR